MEARQIIFLVGGMDAVIIQPEADQQRIQPQNPLEIPDNRDRPARADGDGGAVAHDGQRGAGCGDDAVEDADELAL
mgnify:CR=1 FL=1